MIIFYEKKTGTIVGVIEGRVHHEDQLKAWIGDKNETDRLIIQWKSVNERTIIEEKPVQVGIAQDKKGFAQPAYKKMKFKTAIHDLEPDHEQKDICIELDRDQMKVYTYKVDVKSQLLVKKTV